MRAWWLLCLCMPAWAQEPGPGLGRALAATCATCHGTDGRAVGSALPSLAGIKAETLLERLTDYRSGRLPGTVMPQITRGYTEAQLQLIAAYFAAQPPAPRARP